ncbi:hypothetical protein Dimus_031183 [Dionaea muscipula]
MFDLRVEHYGAKKASMAAIMSVSSILLLLFARISALGVAVLVLIWALAFKASFIPLSISSTQDQESFIYAVLHPLLMVIGFIILSGEGVAFASGIFGIWTKFHGDDGIVANFYSLHSWMGLVCVFMFGTQWMMGFLNFWHRGEIRSVRARILPWHVFVGLYTYGLAVATAETGLLEKLTFMQTNRNLSRHGSESIVVNLIGLGLLMLSSFVILVAVSPKHHM